MATDHCTGNDPSPWSVAFLTNRVEAPGPLCGETRFSAHNGRSPSHDPSSSTENAGQHATATPERVSRTCFSTVLGATELLQEE